MFIYTFYKATVYVCLLMVKNVFQVQHNVNVEDKALKERIEFCQLTAAYVMSPAGVV